MNATPNAPRPVWVAITGPISMPGKSSAVTPNSRWMSASRVAYMSSAPTCITEMLCRPFGRALAHVANQRAAGLRKGAHPEDRFHLALVHVQDRLQAQDGPNEGLGAADPTAPAQVLQRGDDERHERPLRMLVHKLNDGLGACAALGGLCRLEGQQADANWRQVIPGQMDLHVR